MLVPFFDSRGFKYRVYCIVKSLWTTTYMLYHSRSMISLLLHESEADEC